MRRISFMLAALLVFGGASIAAAVAVTRSATTVIQGAVTYTATTTIVAGDTLQFNPNVSTTLTVQGNLIIKGTLEMHPAAPGIVHKIVFSTANESAFQGSVTTPVESDDGLWVIEGGKLDLAGAAKTEWAKATAALDIGDTQVTLDRDPIGWQLGDEIVFAPTNENDYTGFDRRKITGISGRTITFAAVVAGADGLSFEHQAVTLPTRIATAEVLNLTRNVRIQGMKPAAAFPNDATDVNNPGRTHVFISNNVPTVHTISYASIQYTGPRKFVSTGGSKYVLGRYGLHFHMSGENNRGTNVTGVVVRDSGSHAFVPHGSNGITFTKTIAYNDAETAYWWDVKANEETFLNNDVTKDTNYNGVMAAWILNDVNRASSRLAGVSASCGTGNKVINSTIVGVQTKLQTSAILWPEGANDCANTWNVTNNVAHNNEGDGFFIWQNDFTDPHNQTHTFVSYRNGGACVELGAYKNAFDFDHVTCVDDDGGYHPAWNNPAAQADVVLHATSLPTDPQVFADFVIRGNNRIPSIFRAPLHQSSAGAPTVLKRFDVAGYTGHAISIAEDPAQHRGYFDFICWTLPGPRELQPNSTDFDVISIHPGSIYRLQQSDGSAYQMSTAPPYNWTQLADFALAPSCAA